MAGEDYDEPNAGDLLDEPSAGDLHDELSAGDLHDEPSAGDLHDEPYAGDLHDVLDVPEDSHTPQVQETDNDLGGGEKKWPGWPGENVFRMLIPVQKVGGIIGRKGEFIKKITEETKARIKILDGPPGTTERAVLRKFKATNH